MYKKICPTCSQKSFSSCERYDWECPVCTADLSFQNASILQHRHIAKEYPAKRQLSMFLKGYKINQQA